MLLIRILKKKKKNSKFSTGQRQLSRFMLQAMAQSPVKLNFHKAERLDCIEEKAASLSFANSKWLLYTINCSLAPNKTPCIHCRLTEMGPS